MPALGPCRGMNSASRFLNDYFFNGLRTGSRVSAGHIRVFKALFPREERRYPLTRVPKIDLHLIGEAFEHHLQSFHLADRHWVSFFAPCEVIGQLVSRGH